MPEHMRGDDTLGGQDGSDYQYTHATSVRSPQPQGTEGIALLKRLIATADVVWRTSDPT